MVEEGYLNLEEKFENFQSNYITEQFLDNEVGEIEVKHPAEAHSILLELEGRNEDDRNHLISHLDSYANDIPVDTNGQTMTADEIAEEIRDFIGGKENSYKSFSEDGYDAKGLVLDQTSIFLGDRLRYFPESQHRK